MKAPLFIALTLGLVTAAPLSAQVQDRSPQTPFRAAIVREGILLAQSTTNSPAPPARQRSWRARHPVAFGVTVGSISGSVVGSVILAAGCHNGEGPCSPVGATMWMATFAGFGAAGGALIGTLSDR